MHDFDRFHTVLGAIHVYYVFPDSQAVKSGYRAVKINLLTFAFARFLSQCFAISNLCNKDAAKFLWNKLPSVCDKSR